MVTENVEMDLNITNGTCGEIVGIVLHEDEPQSMHRHKGSFTGPT